MPRRSKGPHLWLRPEKRQGGKLIRRARWIIIDGFNHIATGCTATEAAEAQQRLAEYIAAKYQPSRKAQDIEAIDVADVLSIYLDDCGPQQAYPTKLEERVRRLNEFFGNMKLAHVTGETCRQYACWRGNDGGARRDLEDFRAAINHHLKEGLHRGTVHVTLPRKGVPRDRWFTRDEVAAFIRVCLRTREVQTVHKGPAKGQRITTDKRPLLHLARFVLLGLYTGTRASAITTASLVRGQGRSFVDLETGIFYRRTPERHETNKRQPPVPIPPRLLAHIRRWKAKGLVRDYLVEWNGRPVRSVKTAFATAVRLANLSGKVTPHTLRHTAATWLMQAGVDKWEAAGFLGMSIEMLDRVYGHHHPEHLKRAARALGYRQRQSLAISLPLPRTAGRTLSQATENIGGPGRTRTSNQTVMSGRL